MNACMQGHTWNLCSMWYTPRSACEHSVRSAAVVVRLGTHSSSGGGGASARLRVGLRLGACLALPCGSNALFPPTERALPQGHVTSVLNCNSNEVHQHLGV